MLAAVQYPITDLFSASFAGMYFVDQKGLFLGPTLNYSVKENLDFSFIVQYFTLKTVLTTGMPEERINYFFGFLRLKKSF